MNQILLSSQRLDNSRVLQNGTLDVFEMLEKQGKLDVLKFETPFPKQALTLEWKEVQTPQTASSLKDLAGKKLLDYKFQYLGQFKYNGELIAPAGETFSSAMAQQAIHNSTLESTGWVNCTWLLDFLMNAQAIQEKDTWRKEFLIWRQEKNRLVLALSAESIDQRSAEQQKFVFSNDFSTLTWEHHTLFAR